MVVFDDVRRLLGGPMGTSGEGANVSGKVVDVSISGSAGALFAVSRSSSGKPDVAPTCSV